MLLEKHMRFVSEWRLVKEVDIRMGLMPPMAHGY